METKKIPDNFYKKIIDNLPIFCVDAVVVHQKGFLLVRRKNNPLKGRWFLPGGRVLRGEKTEAAVKRKIKEELGIQVRVLMPLGYHEDFYKENEFNSKKGIHTIGIIFLVVPLSLDVKLDNQSSDWKFSQKLPKELKIKPFGGFQP